MINLDFADVRTVMKGMGIALMGVGHAKGDGAAVKAMKMAIDSKLLEENSIKGARGALINITGSANMPLDEIEEAIELIQSEASEHANIIFGTVISDDMDDEVKITVIATGFDKTEAMASGDSVYSETVNEQPIFHPNYSPTDSKNNNFDIPTFIRRKAD